MASYRSFRDLDWALLLIALAICSLGILQIYSATHATVWKGAWWKQSLFVCAGLAALAVISRLDYHTLLGRAPAFYVVSVAALVAVLLFGAKVAGARRWLPLPGGLMLQVSEFVKLVILLLVARYLAELKTERIEGRDLLKLGGLVALPMILVMKQPDLGTALTYLPIPAVGVLVAGLRWKHFLVALVLGLLAPLFAYHFVLKEYQKARLVSFLDPSEDPRGSGYQVIQSQIAVGSGGMWGRGVTRGTQTQLRFLPVPHTDFIFATFGEEHGFVGVVVLLALYFLLLMQIVHNAQTAPDRAGMYLCMGVAGLLLFHLLVNVGMVVGRMPVTGIPLPLMSAGGSSTLSVFIMLGLVNSVRLRRFLN
jgi:rod shape determining protein RodA